LEGQSVRTQGIVTGFFEGNYPDGGSFDGFFIQDPAGDGITTTADALYVNHESLAVAVDVGDWVTVTGVVQEFGEYDRAACIGEGCWTQIAVAAPADVETFGSGTIAPAVFTPRGDPAEGRAYYESLEGMLLTLPQTGTVVGPTNYGTVMVVPATVGISHVLRLGPYAGMPVGLRHYERYGEIGGGDPPNLIVGSVITGTTGPLAYSYGNYVVTTQAGAPWSEVYAQPEPSPVPTWPPAGPLGFTLLSFNVENFFDTVDDPGKNDPIVSPGDYAVKRTKIARTIAQAGCPAVVGLQEVEKLAVLDDVATDLATTYGCTYTATLLEGLDGRGIDVGYLTRDDVATIAGVWQYQDCTTYDTGLGQGDCPAGQQLLFSRIPLVLTATIQLSGQPSDTITATLIVNHLKSKLSRSGDPESATWRLLQAQSLATLTNDILTNDPDALLVVFGDLNDFEDAPPLEALYTTGQLTNTWYTLPPEARYSYIYNGVSQILDHVLISLEALDWVSATGVLHYNADMPFKPYAEDPGVVWATSDHDPPVVTLALPPCQPVTATDFVWTPLTPTLGQVVTFTATAAGDPPFSYSWDWGDSFRSGAPEGIACCFSFAETAGSSSDVGPVVTHTYTAAGFYTVTLTVTNTCGLDTHSQVIVVLPAQHLAYLPLVVRGYAGR
jgi:predicted extracellular nuclease